MSQILQAAKGNYNFSLVLSRCLGTPRQTIPICCSRYFAEDGLSARAFSALRGGSSSFGLIWSSTPATSALMSMKQCFCCSREGWGYLGCLSSLSFQRQELILASTSNTVIPYIWKWKKQTHTSVLHCVHGNGFCGGESVLLLTCSK